MKRPRAERADPAKSNPDIRIFIQHTFILIAKQRNMSGHGGSRRGAGRNPTFLKGQTTLDGSRAKVELYKKNRRKKPPRTKEEARREREDQEQRSAQAAAREEELKEKQEAILQEKRKKKERDLIDVEKKVKNLQDLLARVRGGGTEDDQKEGDLEDDDEEDYEDYDVDPDTDDNIDTQQMRQSKAYKPPVGSPLGKYLTNIKDKILANMADVEKGKHWFSFDHDPLGSDSIDYLDWCHEVNSTIYLHHPFVQYSRKIPKKLSEYKCIHCGEKEHLQSNGWHWRPMHHMDRIDWLLHRRIKHRGKNGEGCGKTFAEYHPKFMAQLPTVVASRFPFVATVRGLGIHQSMMYQFLCLATKGVLFSTYCRSVNEAKETRYWQQHASYLDSLAEYMEGRNNLGGEDFFVAKPFCAYQTIGEYNGIRLKPSLLKNLFVKVMEVMEDYLQESFQLHVDEGIQADHTFKFAKMIMAAIRKGKVFHASYDALGLDGFINFNRLTHTKSNSEIRPLIAEYRKVRLNTGALKLKRFEGDGGSDRLLWPEHFPELLEGIRAWQPQRKNNLPVATMPKESILRIETQSEAENWSLSVIQKIAGVEGDIYYGLDTENNVDFTSHITRTIQLRFSDNVEAKAVVFCLTEMNVFSKADFPPKLKALLELPRLIPVAVQIAHDISRLENLGVKPGKFVELIDLAKELEPSHNEGYGMHRLGQRILGLYIDKFAQKADWTVVTDELLVYAALDAHIHLLLYQKMQQQLQERRDNGTYAKTPLSIGKPVQLIYRGRTCAVGVLDFIGAKNGERRKWGNSTIGVGKSLVTVTKITAPGVRPAFDFIPDVDNRAAGMQGWKRNEVTLSEIFETHGTIAGLTLAWPTGRLEINIHTIDDYLSHNKEDDNKDGNEVLDNVNDDESVDEDQPVDQSRFPQSRFWSFRFWGKDDKPDKETGDDQPEDDVDVLSDDQPEDDLDVLSDVDEPVDKSESEPQDTVEEPVNNLSDDEDDYASDDDLDDYARSKIKSDRFHIFYNLPCTQDNKKYKGHIRRLIIQGTIEFDVDDWTDVRRYLCETQGIDTLEGTLDHFFFNREWWYRRVRVYPPSARKGAQNIRDIREYIASTKPLSDAFKGALEKYFDDIEELYERGEMEESADVALYQWDGKDKNGLNLWIRKRGSSRSENVHQSMRSAFGPWGVGPEIGHYLLLLVSYRYNVNTGIRRMGWVDFGIPWYHLIDRIQLRMIQLFEHDPFPNHTNQALFQPIKGFVAVGVGPLCYDDDFVEKSSEPHQALKGGLRFLAKRMKLRGPPLDLAHKEEFSFFNEFMKTKPRVNRQNWVELAKQFKAKANYVSIFPKLPSQLARHYVRWKANQEVILAKEMMKTSYYALLSKLASPLEVTATRAVDHQRRETAKQVQQASVQITETNTEALLREDPNRMPDNPLPVAPIGAPQQQQYVIAGDGRTKDKRLCAAAAFGCPRLARDCAYHDAKECGLVLQGEVQLPDDPEERQRMKMNHKLKRNRETRAARREAKKRSRVQS